MTKLNPEKIEDWLSKNSKRELDIILAAGFETRSKALIERLIKESDMRLRNAIVLDYENKDLNEPTRSKIISAVRSNFESYEVIPLSDLEVIAKEIGDDKGDALKVVDISGMSRVLIFELLHRMLKVQATFNIGYTEAEDYYPDQQFYERLKEKKLENADFFFDTLDEIVERKEIIYSYNCKIVQPTDFRGTLEPGLPSVLIGFLAFKRSRIQAILSSYEFSVRVFILNKPVRPGLSWRTDLMHIINADVLRRRPSKIITLETLNPFASFRLLNREIVENPDCKKANIYLAPLGSKMQTIGSYFFWRKHPDISVIFSQPSEYFADSFSAGWKDTFIVPHESLSSIS